MRKTIFISLLFLVNLYSQNDTTFTLNVFDIHLSEKTLEVKNPAGKDIFSKTFNSATFLTADLDNDGSEEIIATDNYQKNGKREFSVYIFSTVDSFYLAGSVNSGYLEPYLQNSDERETDILITGNPALNKYNENSTDIFYPLVCWGYDNGELYDCSDELYDIFINENEGLTDYIDEYLQTHEKNCNTTTELKNIIASIYLNYESAEESIMAQQFLKNYYFCNDSAAFKSDLDLLLKKEE